MPGPLLGRLPSSGNTVRRLLIASMVLGFASLIAAGIAAAWVIGRNQQHTDAVVHTYQVEQEIAAFRVRLEQAETARRGYLIYREPGFLADYRLMTGQLPAVLDRLETLTADNPHETARIARLRVMTAQLAQFQERTIALVNSRQASDAISAFRDDPSIATMRNVRAVGAAMVREERALLAQRDAVQRGSVQLFFVILAIAGVLLVLVATITLMTVLRYTHDLQASRDTLRDLADSLEDAVKERTADLTRANEEIQRFAYIVSHDLRSPLVNVMGFTAELDTAARTIADLIDRAEREAPDLVTEDARIAATEDLPESIGFIRSSTEKMDALINAILKLSREGRRVIAPEPLAMDALIEKIRDTLQHRLDDRDAVLIVKHPLPAIVSDRLAVDQIFSNLIENAVKYLKPGPPGRIEVRGSAEGGRAIFEVEDNGRGIDPRDHQRVFDLFRRSGSQDQPGEGIGLAHVRALAYRLGGIIDVSSTLGEGATFRLSLPTTFLQPQDDKK